jgi:hypothetical protein
MCAEDICDSICGDQRSIVAIAKLDLKGAQACVAA